MSNTDINPIESFKRNKEYLIKLIEAYPNNANLVVVDCLMLLKMYIDQIEDIEMKNDLYNVAIQSIEVFRT